MVASLVGDPARSNMLTALMTGRALTASELAHQAGVTPQTASSHLAKLEAGGLIEQEKQGRHRYYRLADPDVAAVLEGLEGVAARAGHLRVRTGPKDPALRRARVYYDHLAGDLGVQMLDSMKRQRLLRRRKQDVRADRGRRAASWRRACRSRPTRSPIRVVRCARPVSTGASGAITSPARLARRLLNRFTELKWAARDPAPGSRVVNFTRQGEKRFAALFGANE